VPEAGQGFAAIGPRALAAAMLPAAPRAMRWQIEPLTQKELQALKH
jgi:hypothetical protein